MCLLVFLLSPAPSAATENSPWRWSGVQRVVAIPDIHGAYTELTGLLTATGIVDESLHWSAGKTHLVSLGDLLDRGADSRKVMDLLMRLQLEAQEQGGQVHVIAGNHEIMNLVGDLRYVSAGEYAAYSDLESGDKRQAAYRAFEARRDEAIALSFLGGAVNAAGRDPKIRLDFEEQYPPGYFGHRNAFAPNNHYGQWLLSLPAMIVINRTVFVHGGLPSITATASVDALNRDFHSDLKRYFDLWDQLINAGVLTQGDIQTNRLLAIKALRVADPSTCPREDRAACARERGLAKDGQRSPPPSVLAALRELIELQDSPIVGPTGPLWYRGSVRCKDVLEMPVLLAALDNLQADRVVVGHTPTNSRRVQSIRDDRLIMLDTGMLTSHYRGRPSALIIERDSDGGEKLTVQYLNPTERVTTLGHGRNGPYPWNRAQLRKALLDGKIVDVEKGWFGASWQVELEYQGVTLRAVFFPANTQGSDQRELAAARLDELLGFDLIPVTVARQIAGDRGALQLAYDHFLTESRRTREGLEAPTSWCPLTAQRHLLEIFDLLIDNSARSRSSIGYVQPFWDLQASQHGDAFAARTGLADPPPASARELPGAVWNVLRSLDENNLQDALGQYLAREQIAALLARRDAILAVMSPPAE